MQPIDVKSQQTRPSTRPLNQYRTNLTTCENQLEHAL